MTIIFYSNASDKRYVTKAITEIATIENAVLLDDNISVTTPSFRVVNVDFTTINYCYVPEFKRYYYISNYRFEFGKQIVFDCVVDVLMSFANEIKNTNAIVIRANVQGNVLINDELQPIRVDDILTNLAFTGSEFINEGVGSGNYSFLLNCFGGVKSGT